MKVFVFSLFLMVAFSFQGYTSDSMTYETENVEMSLTLYQVKEKDCKEKADATWWAVMEHTNNEYMADFAYYQKYNSCMA